MTASDVQFGVLGPVEMKLDGVLVALGAPKQRAVLATLLVNLNRAVGIDALIDAVWEQRAPQGARSTVHSYVSNLRGILSGAGADPHAVLASVAPGYRLNAAESQWDLGRFRAEMKSGVAAATASRFEPACKHLTAALAEWRGEVLDGLRHLAFADNFATAIAEDRLVAQTCLAEAEIACERPDTVIAGLEVLAAANPHREPLWVQLITAYYLAERQSDALNAYHRLKTALTEDLGIDPGLKVRTLYDRILRQQPLDVQRGNETGHPRPARPAATGQRAGRVPSLPIGVIGRDGDSVQLREQLAVSRLVTLTGIGGIGKTTLAACAAHEARSEFADGVWWVELGELRDGSLLAEFMAAALGLRDQAGRQVTEVLADFLAPRTALVVIDNCEHIIDDLAKLADALLRDCPGLRILATSRELLRVSGESVLHLSPLPVPDVDARPTLSNLAELAGVALFTQRARAAVSGFALTNQNADAVARICAGLDGLPLALELAASRLRAMSVDEVAEGLSDRYGLLTRGRRGVTGRQRTLSGCIGWSYQLCTATEQRFWALLSVFAGSFDAGAAHAVCGGDLSVADCRDVLSDLVDKSILVRADHDRGVRFKLLETLREYGKNRIEGSADYPLLRRRHADWYQRLLAEADAHWFGPDQLAWIRRLVLEMPNIREALRFAVVDAPYVALQLTAYMRRIWILLGMLGEGRRWLDLALSAAPPEPSLPLVRSMFTLSQIAIAQLDLAAIAMSVAEARRLLEVVDDPATLGLINFAEGSSALVAGDFDTARDRLERALAATDDLEAQVWSSLAMGWLTAASGDVELAQTWFDRGGALAEARGDSLLRAHAKLCVAAGRWANDDRESAQQLLRQSLQISQPINDAWTVAQCLEVMAWVAGSSQNLTEAVVLMAAALAVARACGCPVVPVAFVGPFHADCERRAREQLTAAEYEHARGHGDAMNFDQAIAFALDA